MSAKEDGDTIKPVISRLTGKSASELTFEMRVDGELFKAKAVLAKDKKSFVFHVKDPEGDTDKYTLKRK